MRVTCSPEGNSGFVNEGDDNVLRDSREMLDRWFRLKSTLVGNFQDFVSLLGLYLDKIDNCVV